MGCGASTGKDGIPGLSYDKEAPIANGGHKNVFAGVYQDQKVAVVVARPGGEKTITHEIELFRKLGKHPHIIEMVVYGKDCTGMPSAAMEAVEPIGYDMSRLVNQYSWTGQVVPEPLMCKLLRQLISALQHMHDLSLIHQDLKVQNVLVTLLQDAKLIDMGIVRKIGETGNLQACYLAPEVCLFEKLTPKVDCWGVGLILHQAYQFEAQLLRIRPRVKMRLGVPSQELPMAADVKEAMQGLLEFDPAKRWSLQNTLDSSWFKNSAAPHKGLSFSIGECQIEGPRRFLQKYVASDPGGAQTAYAVRITSEQTEFVGKCLGELSLGKNFGITVLLVAHAPRVYDTLPGRDTKLSADTWMYLGIKTAEASKEDDEVDEKNAALTGICQKLYGKNFKEQAHDTSQAGRLVAFTLEFDCFTFPDRKSGEYVLGANAGPGQVALDLRNTLNLNIAGIVSKTKGTEWYPGANSTAQPGDLGLIVRAPQLNGTSEPTVQDQDLEALMASCAKEVS